MYDPNSPILDFYPLEFDLDLNGKKQDWEAIVKIPFIDEVRLLKAMAGVLSFLVLFVCFSIISQTCLCPFFSPRTSSDTRRATAEFLGND